MEILMENCCFLIRSQSRKERSVLLMIYRKSKRYIRGIYFHVVLRVIAEQNFY